MHLRRLTKEEVRFEPLIRKEIIDPKEVFKDRLTLMYLDQQEQNGNEYGWFCATVVAYWGIFKGGEKSFSDCLSFPDEAAFLASKEYADLCSAALSDLNHSLELLFDDLKSLVKDGEV